MTLEALAHLSRAEDFLRFFGIDHDPRVLAVHRLHVLKRFGEAVAAVDARRPLPPEDERLARYREALREAYALYASGRGRMPFRAVQGGLVSLGGGGAPRADGA